MKKIVFIIFLFQSLFNYGQNTASIDELADDVNKDLKFFFSLNSYSDIFYKLDALALHNELLASYFKADSETSNNFPDSIEEMELIDLYRIIITDKIFLVMNHDDFITSDKLSLFDENYLQVVQSDDKKLCNFSFEGNERGTYRWKVSIMYFDEIGVVKSQVSNPNSKEIQLNPYGIFESDGYDEIISIETEEGTKYILTGYVRSCTSCFYNHIGLLSFRNGQFEREFFYDVSSDDSNSGIRYFPETKMIRSNYETSIFDPICSCINEDIVIESNEDSDKEFIPGLCTCEFIFDGKNFEIFKQYHELIIEDEE